MSSRAGQRALSPCPRTGLVERHAVNDVGVLRSDPALGRYPPERGATAYRANDTLVDDLGRGFGCVVGDLVVDPVEVAGERKFVRIVPADG